MTAAEAQQIALQRLLLVVFRYGVTLTGEGWDNWRVGAVVEALTNSGNALLPAYQQAAAADLRNARRLAGSKVARLDGATVADFRQLADLNSANDVFKAVHGGVEFIHVMANSVLGNYGFTDPDFHGRRIEVYNQAFAIANDPAFTFHFPAHELGHAFNQRAGRTPENNLGAANMGNFTPAWPWAQSDGNTNSEDFADMYLGWAANHLEAGRMRWMNNNMPRWIPLAVTGN